MTPSFEPEKLLLLDGFDVGMRGGIPDYAQST